MTRSLVDIASDIGDWVRRWRGIVIIVVTVVGATIGLYGATIGAIENNSTTIGEHIVNHEVELSKVKSDIVNLNNAVGRIDVQESQIADIARRVETMESVLSEVRADSRESLGYIKGLAEQFGIQRGE